MIAGPIRGFAGAGAFLAANGTGGAIGELLLWAGVLIGAALVILPVFLYVRRLAQRERPTPSPFTLEGLEEMRSAGQISPEEFAELRRRLLGARPGPDSSSSGPTGDDDEGKADAEGTQASEEK